MRRATTPFLLVTQHDFVLRRRFDAPALLRTMAADARVKHVRLNMRPNVPRGFDGVLENVTGYEVPRTRACICICVCACARVCVVVCPIYA